MQKHILIVEDDPFMLEIAAVKLTEAGYAVASLRDGAAVLSYLDSEPVDLVLLDLDLPHLHGVDILAALRQSEQHRTLPVIVFTNNVTEAVQEICATHHATYFYKAETGTDALVATVEKLLREE